MRDREERKKRLNCKSYRKVFFWVILIALEIFYFREIIFNTHLFGDAMDGKFCNVTIEHWFRVLAGKDSVTNVRMFYPAKNTVGYSDMLLMYVPIYCAFRFIGVNMYIAYKYTLIFIHIAGTAVFAHFLKNKLNLSFVSTLIGVFIFGYSNPYSTSYHTQLFAYFFIPFLLLFAYNFFVFFSTRRKRIIYGILTVLFFDGLFYTSFYMGMFLCIFLMVLGSVTLLVFKICGCSIIKTLHNKVKKYGKILWKYVVIAGIGLVPFALLEFSVMREYGSRGWKIVVSYMPNLDDIINVHSGNLIYHWLGNLKANNVEMSQGFPILILVFFLAGVVKMVKKIVSAKKESSLPNRIYASTGIAVLLIMLSIVRFGEEASLWYVFYKLVPGVSAIRAIVRFYQFLCIPIAIFLACLSEEMVKFKSMIIKGMLVFCVFIQYIWIGAICSDWDEKDALVLEEVAPPPEACEIMCVKNPEIEEGENINCYKWSLDATIIANYFDLECINGYSGQFPQDFTECINVVGNNYEQGIEKWVSGNGLDNVYAYDLKENKWQKIK